MNKIQNSVLSASFLSLALINPLAAQTNVEPMFSMSAGYNDNYTLESNSAREDSVSIGDVELGLVIARVNARSKTILVPNINLQVVGETDQDYDASEGGLSVAHRTLFSTSEFRFLAGYTNQLTFTSEFLDIDFEDADTGFASNDITGNVRQRSRQESIRINPEWFWDISPRTEISIRARYQDISYDQDVGLSDYSEGRLNAVWTRKMTERLHFGINGYVGFFDTNDSLSDSDSYGAEARVSWKLSETSAGWLRLGSARKSDNDDTTSDSNKVIAALGIRRNLPRGNLRLDFSRNQTGSSLGEIVVRDNLRLTYRHSVTQRITSNFGLRFSKVGANDDTSSTRERNLGRLEAGIDWAVSQKWSLRLRFDKRLLDVEGEPDQAESNAVFLSFSFRGQQPVRVSDGKIQSPWR